MWIKTNKQGNLQTNTSYQKYRLVFHSNIISWHVYIHYFVDQALQIITYRVYILLPSLVLVGYLAIVYIITPLQFFLSFIWGTSNSGGTSTIGGISNITKNKLEAISIT